MGRGEGGDGREISGDAETKFAQPVAGATEVAGEVVAANRQPAQPDGDGCGCGAGEQPERAEHMGGEVHDDGGNGRDGAEGDW